MHSQGIQILNAFAVLSLMAAPYVSADMITPSSVPQSCMAICNPVVELTNKCDIDMNMLMSGMNPSSGNGGMEMNMEKRNDMEMNMEKRNDMEMNMEKRDDMDMNMDGMDMEEMSMQEQKAEMDCVCNNKSFDVGKVMGLCASCLGMEMSNANKTVMEAVDSMMSGCSFSTTSYAPSATSVLSGLQVEATQPVITMMAGDMDDMNMNSSMTGAASRVEVATGFWGVGMITASLGLGAGIVFGMI